MHTLSSEDLPSPHKPVFLCEFLDFFQGSFLKTFVDATVGAGGHSSAILQAHPEIERWIGIDRDASALDLAEKRLRPLLKGKEALFFHTNFSSIPKQIGREIDGLFLDLGVSSMQLDQKERGFSFRFDAPLDMRMDSSQRLHAKEIVNTWSPERLEKLFVEGADEPKARRAARMIVDFRKKKRIETTFELCKALEGLWPRGRNHPATRIFQALRIAVNEELIEIEKAIPLWLETLLPKGRMGVISFHSLEDRRVKSAFKKVAKEPEWSLLTPKPLETGLEERARNPRARSAKLRFLERHR